MPDVDVTIGAREEVSSAAQRASRSLEELKGKSNDVTRSGGDQAAMLGKLQSAYAAATVAIGAAVAMSTKLVSAFYEADEAQNRLANTISVVTGGYEGTTVRLTEFADAMMNSAGASDEMLKSMMAGGIALGRSEEQTKLLTRAALDLAATGLMGEQEAFQQLNLTHEGFIRSLGRMFPELKNLTKEQLEAGDAVKYVEERVHGMAQAMADTASGQMKMFKNALDELQESGGRVINKWFAFMLPILKQGVDWLTTTINKTMDLYEANKAVEDGHATAAQKLLVLNSQYDYVVQRMQELQDLQSKGKSLTREQGDEYFKLQLRAGDLKDAIKKLNDELAKQAPGSKPTLQSPQTYTPIWQLPGESGFVGAALRSQQDAAMRNAAMWGPNSSQASDAGVFGAQLKAALGDPADSLRVIAYRQLPDMLAKMGTVVSNVTSPMRQMPDTYMGAQNRIDAAANGAAMSIPMAQQMGSGNNVNGASSSGGNMAGVIGVFSSLLSSLSTGLQTLISVVAAVGIWWTMLFLIAKGAMDVLGPVINEVLSPLIGIFIMLGRVVGQMLVPTLTMLTPVIDALADVFIWLYTWVLAPIGNFIYKLFTVLGNTIANLIDWIGSWFTKWGTRPQSFDQIPDVMKPITKGDISTAGDSFMGGGSSGTSYSSSSSVQQVPDIYIYMTFEDKVIGPGGGREVGEYVVQAIKDYLGTGARVNFLEA